MTNNWTLAYDSFEPEEEGLREALTSTGNGYFCTRGALAWSEADGVSYLLAATSEAPSRRWRGGGLGESVAISGS